MPKPKHLGVVSVSELERRHGLPSARMAEILRMVGIDRDNLRVPNRFGMLTRSEAERLLFEVYRAKGARVRRRLPKLEEG